jgi:asparagine synthase (glutamine-hydrolysing)
MGDFFLDFRPPAERRASLAAEMLRFMAYTQVSVIEDPGFSLAVSNTEDPAPWGHYRSPEGILVAFAGRVALDEAQWQAAESLRGPGGLAAKALFLIYRMRALAGIQEVSGNCALFVSDPASDAFHIIADPAGAFPVFEVDAPGKPVFSSHPDVLARATGEQGSLDEVSLAEFLLTSTVTPPFTYYRRIRFMEPGTVTTLHLASGQGNLTKTSRRYFDMSFQSNGTADEDDLSDELAQAIRISVRRRTLPRLGRTAVALSGGLDSRAILACIENKDTTFAFTCFNEPNRELSVAQEIAGALQVRFLPWQRELDYYGNNAELGVRISGGMGTFANNHFLGVVDRLRKEGAQNLLTGCYCDYLFKALPLNRRTHWLTGREHLAPFSHEFYFSHHLRPTPFASQLRERWESRVPAEFQHDDSDAALFQIEARRTFPLCYEGDNQQRVVPQRVTGWYLPMADRGIMDVYRKIPARFKLNRSIYSKAVRKLCRGPLDRIPDANTGTTVGASAATECLSAHWLRARRKLARTRQTISTDGSWPDWDYYVRHSPKLQALWQHPNAQATDFFRHSLGPDAVRPQVADYQGRDTFFLVSLLSLKLWFEQWHS